MIDLIYTLYNFLSLYFIEFIMVIVSIFGQYLNWHETKKDESLQSKYSNLSLKQWIQTMLVLTVMMPILEESLFRCSLPTIFGNSFNLRVIYSIMFGLVHVFNYIFTPNINLVGYQVVMTMFLGYYLSTLQTIQYAMFAHGFYNLIILLCQIAVAYFNGFTQNINNKIDRWGYYYHIETSKLKKSTSDTKLCDIVKTKKNYEAKLMKFHYIYADKIVDEPLKKSIMEFQEICFKKDEICSQVTGCSLST
jgi:hypothetical protein